MNGEEVADKPVPECPKIGQNKPVPKCPQARPQVSKTRAAQGGQSDGEGAGERRGRGDIFCCFRLSERVSCVHH